MAKFEVPVVEIKIEEHPDADTLEIASVLGYKSVVRKGNFKTNSLAVYIPEGSLVPDDVLETMGLKGMLAGKNGNRVKAIKLRGVLSQGILYPVVYGEETRYVQRGATRRAVDKGDNVVDFLDITKYVPEIPASMAGLEHAVGFERTVKYDIENFKNYPDVIAPGEEVVFTEKIHGTFALFGLYMEEYKDFPDRDSLLAQIVSSKGISEKGRAFKLDAPEDDKNLYVRVARHHTIFEKLGGVMFALTGGHANSAVFLMGEIYGSQDLKYGANTGKDETIGFRAFDILVREPGRSDRYVNYEDFAVLCSLMCIETVPVLYRGPFSSEEMERHTEGMETLTGQGVNIREGIVIKPVVERRDSELGRVILKSVSGTYLTRKSKNATEYQ